MSALQTLMEMGFSENASKKALAVTGGGGIEQAMEWLLAHADDPSINEPAQSEAGRTVGSNTVEKMETNEADDVTAVAGDEKAAVAGDEKAAVAGDEKAAVAGDEKAAAEGTEGSSKDDLAEDEQSAKSIKCDDCGKLFRTNEEVEYHAVKSGHENFSESTEEKQPLTKEEKEEKKSIVMGRTAHDLPELQEKECEKREMADKIKLRRKEREQEEEQECRDREKKRIQMGQAIAERKRVMQEMEIKKLAEERRREKLEDKLARQKVKDQIERDRQAQKEMFANKSNTEAKPAPPPPAAAQSSATPQPPAQKKEYTHARLQIRLPSGAPLVQEFKAKETLSAVRLWISLNRTDSPADDTPIKLSMSFPRKTFTEEDMNMPLDLLGLVPSAVLMVTK